MNILDQVAIVGVGDTPVGNLPGIPTVQLQSWAAKLALEDAGLKKEQVDGLIAFGGYDEPVVMYGTRMAEYLGLRPNFTAQVDVGGVLTPLTSLMNAAVAISMGLCRVVLCTFGENTLTYKTPKYRGTRSEHSQGTEEFEEPFGAISIITSYALIAQRHMYEYGTTSKQLGHVAVSARKHASMNPNAQMKTPITIEDHQKSRMISSPLRMLDCSLITDGAGAFVVTSKEMARDLKKPPISLLGFGIKNTHRIVSQFPSLKEIGIKEAASKAFTMAGLRLKDVDVAEIHDAFTISVILALEGLGFCGEGEGGKYAAEGKLELGNPIPVNTHGGLLSHGHVGGIFHLTEAVKQLRGECGIRQVPNAKIALVSGNGGVFSLCGVSLLGRV